MTIKIFSEMLEATSTEHSPWFILPADDEWHTRRIVTEVMIDTIKRLKPEFPEISQENQQKLEEYINKLKITNK